MNATSAIKLEYIIQKQFLSHLRLMPHFEKHLISPAGAENPTQCSKWRVLLLLLRQSRESRGRLRQVRDTELGCGSACLTLTVTRSVCFKALHAEQRSSKWSRFTYRPSGTCPHCCFSIKHHAANFIYPSWQGTLWQHTAHSVIQSSLLMLSPWKTTRKQTKNKA